MKDVAARAGVSQRTVSNVVRGYVHVHPQTRERVQRVIDEMGYRPNAGAVWLRKGRTGILGLAVPEISVPYFAELADHVQRSAAALGVTLLIDQTGANRERELLVLDGYRSHVIDGLIFSPMEITEADVRAYEPSLPIVLLGERIQGGPFVQVTIDNVRAAIDLTRHLIDAGYQRIAAIGANLTTNNVGAALGRLEGYQAAHEEAGRPVSPELVVTTSGWTRAAGFDAVDGLLSSGTDVDALMCFTDTLAFGALKAVARHGLRVPGDIAVAGWDDVEEASFCVPALTSIAPDKAAIAKAAVDLLIAQVSGTPVAPGQVVLRHRLIVRDST